jgi:hypothetical protein
MDPRRLPEWVGQSPKWVRTPLSGLGLLGEGEDPHRATRLEAEQGIGLIDLFDEVHAWLVAGPRGLGRWDLDHIRQGSF